MNTHDIKQERADFEAWASQYTNDPQKYYQIPAWSAYQAGRAALQSQHETQLQVWRSTDSCGEFWSWDEADQYDYDRAKPENRRVIQIIKEG